MSQNCEKNYNCKSCEECESCNGEKQDILHPDRINRSREWYEKAISDLNEITNNAQNIWDSTVAIEAWVTAAENDDERRMRNLVCYFVMTKSIDNLSAASRALEKAKEIMLMMRLGARMGMDMSDIFNGDKSSTMIMVDLENLTPESVKAAELICEREEDPYQKQRIRECIDNYHNGTQKASTDSGLH